MPNLIREEKTFDETTKNITLKAYKIGLVGLKNNSSVKFKFLASAWKNSNFPKFDDFSYVKMVFLVKNSIFGQKIEF